MAKNTNPVFTLPGDAGVGQITNALGTNAVDVIAAPVGGCKIDALPITSIDTSAKIVALQIVQTSPAKTIKLGQILVPAESGTKSDGTVLPVNGLDATRLKYLQKDLAGNYYLKLKYGQKLQAAAVAALTADKTIDVGAMTSQLDDSV
ncbi:MAG TPA: hypothetical protein PLV42_06830 [bacterium]|nr:hypothetical protein [bacterium]